MPVEAVDDVGTTEQAVPVIIDVQANDIFQVGSNLIAVTDGSNGTVVINADNTVTYTPEDGFSGVDTFTYTALSANGNGESVATVTVTVDPPVVPPPSHRCHRSRRHRRRHRCHHRRHRRHQLPPPPPPAATRAAATSRRPPSRHCLWMRR